MVKGAQGGASKRPDALLYCTSRESARKSDLNYPQGTSRRTMFQQGSRALGAITSKLVGSAAMAHICRPDARGVLEEAPP